MKKITVLFFAAVTVCMFVACDDTRLNNLPGIHPDTDDTPGGKVTVTRDKTVTIGGTVTVTRNNVPWNELYFPSDKYSRAVGPNPYRPSVLAFTAPIPDREYLIDAVTADDFQRESDLVKGTVRWSMEIPADKLPLTVYFGIRCWGMGDISQSPIKMTDGVLITGGETSIDLGTADFTVVQLSGNLPVTVNGEPPDSEYPIYLHIQHSYPFITDVTTFISPNGDWSVTAVQPDSPMPLKFTVEARKNGGVFRKELNPDDVITVYDTDKEVIFPAYTNVDFDAVTLSGTIKLTTSKKRISYLDIHFFKEEVDTYTVWWLQTGYFVKWGEHPQLEGDCITDKDGLVEWKTMVPAFSIPYNLHFWKRATTVGTNLGMNATGSNVTITADTDLSNIYLGEFTVE